MPSKFEYIELIGGEFNKCLKGMDRIAFSDK